MNFKTLFEYTTLETTNLHNTLTKHYKFSSAEKNVLKRYSDESYSLNSYHWAKQKQGKNFSVKKRENDSEILDAIVDHYKTPQAMTLWSGIKKAPKEIKEGGIYHHPAYLSTSIKPKVAFQFADGHKHGNNNSIYDPKTGKSTYHTHVLKINIPQGHAGAYIGENSLEASEHEFLLPRGMKLHINKHIIRRPWNRDGLHCIRHIYEAEPVANG